MNGGWPLLNRDPLPLPELPRNPSPTDHARAYGTTVVLWSRLWTRVVDALEWLHGAWRGLHRHLEELQREVAATRQELLEELRKRPSVRPRVPSFSSFGPEQTLGGAVRIQAPAWEALQRQVAELAEGLDQAEQAKRDAEQRERGANDAIARLETRAEARRRRVIFWLTLAGAAGALLSWVAVHVLHW